MSEVSSLVSKPSNQWPNYLNASILEILNKDFKFETMTPVQSVVIPIFTKQHKDVVVEAITGSGKTLAFVVPILEILLKVKNLKKHDIGALIISPTRELSMQIYQVVESFLKTITSLTSILFVGGNSVNDDLNRFEAQGANIVIATAGRLQDLFSRQSLKTNIKQKFKTLEILILDEADRLLDLGFIICRLKYCIDFR